MCGHDLVLCLHQVQKNTRKLKDNCGALLPETHPITFQVRTLLVWEDVEKSGHLLENVPHIDVDYPVDC